MLIVDASHRQSDMNMQGDISFHSQQSRLLEGVFDAVMTTQLQTLSGNRILPRTRKHRLDNRAHLVLTLAADAVKDHSCSSIRSCNRGCIDG